MAAWATTALVGRRRELELLEAGIREAVAGQGGTVLLAGDAGIGKTRLVTELGARARAAGAQPLLGRCIDLVGAEVPYLPVAEAIRPLLAREDVRKLLGSAHELRWLLPEVIMPEERPRPNGDPPRSQLGLLEELLALLDAVTAAQPIVLVLEDLHWADRSTLDLIAFLAHNLSEHRVLLVGTYRGDELPPEHRLRRLVTGLLRAGVATRLELGPLGREELETLLLSRGGAPLSPALTEAIVTRSEGNPFFAEELLAAADEDGVDLPHVLRDLLLQRVAQLDRMAQGVLRVTAAAGRDVPYPLLRTVADAPEGELRQALRRAVEHGVLVADQTTGTFRFRHALLAEAIYGTLLPGEREDPHGRLAAELARSQQQVAAELAQHWAAAGRAPEALIASVVAAREAEAVAGLAEALQHLERALEFWDLVPEAAELTGLDLAALLEWTAEVADHTGAGPRSVELVRRAIALVVDDPVRAALLHESLGRFLVTSDSYEAALAAFRTAVDLVPDQPITPERVHVLAAFGNALMLGWRHAESRELCEQALELARQVGGARRSEFRALGVLGVDLAYLGRTDEGLGCLWEALHLAEDGGSPQDLGRAYIFLTDVLTMLGRPRESVQVAATGIALARKHGREHGGDMPLVVNLMEALTDIGEWHEADRVGTAAIRAGGSQWPHQRLVQRAALDIGRGDFDRARADLQAALTTVHHDKRGLAAFDITRAELALWERRWDDAEHAVDDGLRRLPAQEAALLRVRLCAQGLRAQAELAALARARRDRDALTDRLQRALQLLDATREAAIEAAVVTPTAAAWRAVAEAEYHRARAHPNPTSWDEAAAAWEALQQPPIVAYCRWRLAEALVTAGAPDADTALPARTAHATAQRLGARPLQDEIQRLAQRARLDLAPPSHPTDKGSGLAELLGLTPREAEVLGLVARGYTNRQIAAALVISTKTASVHVSHILAKLDAQNRVEAAAIAHRLAPATPAASSELPG
jgi:DNA-binding CsgD family transcriptional regulator/tetratricopeptide (TPR) repeat protein